MQHTKSKRVPNPFRIRFRRNTRVSGSVTKHPPGKISFKMLYCPFCVITKTNSQATIHACAQSKKKKKEHNVMFVER